MRYWYTTLDQTAAEQILIQLKQFGWVNADKIKITYGRHYRFMLNTDSNKVSFLTKPNNAPPFSPSLANPPSDLTYIFSYTDMLNTINNLGVRQNQQTSKRPITRHRYVAGSHRHAATIIALLKQYGWNINPDNSDKTVENYYRFILNTETNKVRLSYKPKTKGSFAKPPARSDTENYMTAGRFERAIKAMGYHLSIDPPEVAGKPIPLEQTEKERMMAFFATDNHQSLTALDEQENPIWEKYR